MRNSFVDSLRGGRLALAGGVLLSLILATGCQSTDGWKPLFDGKTLDGWHEHGTPRAWRVEDGALVGELVEPSQYSYLTTDEKFTDFELKLRMIFDSELGNSGVFFRSSFPPQVLNPDIVAFDLPEEANELKNPKTGKTIASLPYLQRVHIRGAQAEFAIPKQWTGGIYDATVGKWVNRDQITDEMQKAHKWHEWNDLYIKVVGRSAIVRLNDVLISDIRDYPFEPTGRIALQLHAGGPMKVRFKDIHIRPLRCSGD